MKKQAFTLVEIMVVVGIIAVVLFMFGGNTNMHSSKMEETGVVLERVATGVDKFRIMNGGFPDSWDADSGSKTPSVYINDFEIGAKTPLGGKWSYSCDDNIAVISMVGVDSKFAESMAMLDKIVDDGDLSTGIFIANNDNYKYLLSRGEGVTFPEESGDDDVVSNPEDDETIVAVDPTHTDDNGIPWYGDGNKGHGNSTTYIVLNDGTQVEISKFDPDNPASQKKNALNDILEDEGIDPADVSHVIEVENNGN